MLQMHKSINKSLQDENSVTDSPLNSSSNLGTSATVLNENKLESNQSSSLFKQKEKKEKSYILSYEVSRSPYKRTY